MKRKGVSKFVFFPLGCFIVFLLVAIYCFYLSPDEYYGDTLFYSLEEYNEFRIYAELEPLVYWVDKYPCWVDTSLNVPRGTTDYKWVGENKARRVKHCETFGYYCLFGCAFSVPYIIYELKYENTKRLRKRR